LLLILQVINTAWGCSKEQGQSFPAPRITVSIWTKGNSNDTTNDGYDSSLTWNISFEVGRVVSIRRYYSIEKEAWNTPSTAINATLALQQTTSH
jgi:hypothetical protein